MPPLVRDDFIMSYRGPPSTACRNYCPFRSALSRIGDVAGDAAAGGLITRILCDRDREKERKRGGGRDHARILRGGILSLHRGITLQIRGGVDRAEAAAATRETRQS